MKNHQKTRDSVKSAINIEEIYSQINSLYSLGVYLTKIWISSCVPHGYFQTRYVLKILSLCKYNFT